MESGFKTLTRQTIEGQIQSMANLLVEFVGGLTHGSWIGKRIFRSMHSHNGNDRIEPISNKGKLGD